MFRVTDVNFVDSYANWGTMSMKRLSELKMVNTNVTVFWNIIPFTRVGKVPEYRRKLSPTLFCGDDIAKCYSLFFRCAHSYVSTNIHGVIYLN